VSNPATFVGVGAMIRLVATLDRTGFSHLNGLRSDRPTGARERAPGDAG
jgi:hypothetical protein